MPETPMPDDPVKPRTVRLCATALPLTRRACELVTVMLAEEDAVAVQISASPRWTAARCTRVHARPPPEIVRVWFVPVAGPSEAASATRTVPDETLNADVVIGPRPSTDTFDASERPAGAALRTLVATAFEVAVLPEPSRATAVSVCGPSATVVVFQTMLNAPDVTSPMSVVPSKNLTPATPTLSAAVALSITLPETVAGRAARLTVGAMVSATTEILTMPIEVSPATSRIS